MLSNNVFLLSYKCGPCGICSHKWKGIEEKELFEKVQSIILRDAQVMHQRQCLKLSQDGWRRAAFLALKFSLTDKLLSLLCCLPDHCNQRHLFEFKLFLPLSSVSLFLFLLLSISTNTKNILWNVSDTV